MLYESGDEYLSTGDRRVFVFGMSGVGKTRIADILRRTGDWYHYSVDYRIGTRYLDERIADSVRRAAMMVPLLRDLLRSDSIVIRPNLQFENLTPLSTWIGAPGDPSEGGLSFAEYCARQRAHEEAEIASTLDAHAFIRRAKEVYNYDRFVCDASGSVCEIADPDDPEDNVFKSVSKRMLPVYIQASRAHRDDLLARFRASPKPMFFNQGFLAELWSEYLANEECTEEGVSPGDFLRFAFERLLDWRTPRYDALAHRWGVTLALEEIAAIRVAADFDQIVAAAIDGHRR